MTDGEAPEVVERATWVTQTLSDHFLLGGISGGAGEGDIADVVGVESQGLCHLTFEEDGALLFWGEGSELPMAAEIRVQTHDIDIADDNAAWTLGSRVDWAVRGIRNLVQSAD